MSKYECPRDEVLDAMAQQGWANESSGDVESPAGWFARIVVTPAELLEVAQAFSDEIESAGMDDSAELVGNFLLVADEQGFTTVYECDSAESLAEAYALQDNEYSAWLDADVSTV